MWLLLLTVHEVRWSSTFHDLILLGVGPQPAARPQWRHERAHTSFMVRYFPAGNMYSSSPWVHPISCRACKAPGTCTTAVSILALVSRSLRNFSSLGCEVGTKGIIHTKLGCGQGVCKVESSRRPLTLITQLYTSLPRISSVSVEGMLAKAASRGVSGVGGSLAGT